MSNSSELDVVIKGRDELSPTLQELQSKVIRYVGAVSAALAGIKLISGPIVAAANFERELANVRKTTNFTKNEINQLGDALSNMSTRIDVSAVDLAKIAAAAGQQGLGKDGVAGVLAFTDSVSRMASVLDITAEEAANNVGKILNIFHLDVSEVERVASVINQISNNSTANGKELLDTIKRIGDGIGALRIEDAAALAATGLDLGQSSEVVGTAVSKLNASLLSNAPQWAKLLKKPVQEWVKYVQTDGIGAIKATLVAMRGLNPENQQLNVKKLVGTGRNATFYNKLLQDSTDSVLEKNRNQAAIGKLGESAKKEQRIVLETLKAQAVAAANSIADTARTGAQATLAPLTQYAAQLNKAFQSPAFQSFVNAIGKAFVGVAGLIDTAVTALSKLNVNWDNLVTFVKLFLGLKVYEYIIKVASGFSVFGVSLKSIAADAARTRAELAGLGTEARATAAKLSIGTQIKNSFGGAEFRQAYDSYRNQKRAVDELARSQLALATAERTAAVAATRVDRTQTVAAGAGGRVSAAEQVVQAQGAKVLSAQAAVDAARLSSQQALDARLLRAETEFNAKKAASTAAYQLDAKAIRATGTTVGMTALKRAYAEEQAALDLHNARSVRTIQSNYAARLAVTVAGLEAQVAAETAAYAQADTALAARLASQRARQGAVGLATGVAATAGVEVAAASAGVLAAEQSALRAGTAFSRLGPIVAGVVKVFGTLGSLLIKGLGVVGLVVTLLDLAGVLDKIPAYWTRLTDALGFSSKATRDLALEKENLAKKTAKEKNDLADLIDKYKEYYDTVTGVVNKKTIDADVTQARISLDPAKRQQSVANLGGAFSASQESLRQAEAATTSGTDVRIAAKKKEIEAIAALEIQAEQQRKAREIQYASVAGGGEKTKTYVLQLLTDKISGYASSIKVLQGDIAKLEADAVGAKPAVASLQNTIDYLGEAAAGFFTPETLSAAEQFVPELVKRSAELKELADKQVVLNNAIETGQDVDKAQALANETNMNLARAKYIALRVEAEKFIKTQLATPGLSATVISSWEFLLGLITKSDKVSKNIVAAAAFGAGADPAALTGKNAPGTPVPPRTGSGINDPEGGAKGEAKRLARAQLELYRAQIQAETALTEEKSKEKQTIEDNYYQRGLVAAKEYYTSKLNLQLDTSDREIADKRLELAAIDKQAADAEKASERVRFKAEAAKVRGQIAVLTQQQNGIIEAGREGLRKDTLEFADTLDKSTADLMNRGIIRADFNTRFKANLTTLLDDARVRIAKLRSEGNYDRANTEEAALKLPSYNLANSLIDKQLDNAKGSLSLFTSQVASLQNAGSLTTVQAMVAIATKAEEIRPILVGLLADKEAALKSIDGVVGVSAEELEAAKQAVAGVRLSIAQLNQTVNAFAIDFNKNVTGSIATGLSQYTGSLNSLKEAARSVFLSIAGMAKDALSKNIAENFMQSMTGGNNAGGIGGFVQSFLGTKGGGGPDGTAARPIHVTTKDLADLSGKVPDKFGLGGDDPIKDLTDGLKSKAEGVFGGILGTLKDSFSGLDKGLGGIFSSLYSSLSSLLGGAGGGGGIGGLGSILALFAHTGGVVGASALRSSPVNPAIFANAVRYHTGGVAGLKPDEVPVVLQKGEEVLTANDARHRDNIQSADAADAMKNSAKGVTNIWVVTPDQQQSVGPNDVIVTVADNISRGGSLRKLIKTI